MDDCITIIFIRKIAIEKKLEKILHHILFAMSVIGWGAVVLWAYSSAIGAKGQGIESP